MAYVPKLYSNYTFPNEHFSQFPNQENCTGGGASATWAGEEIGFPLMFLDNGGMDIFQQESNLTSPVPALFPELTWNNSSDMDVPTALSHHNNVTTGYSGIQNYGTSRYQLMQDVYDFGEECTGMGFVHQDFKPVDPNIGQNWGIEGNRIRPVAMEESNLKVGRYSVEERKDRILRYLKKRNQRNFNKTIKYACRKTLADRRVRVRGRFARNSTTTEVCEEDQEMVLKKEDDDNSPNDKNFNSFCEAVQQMKHDEDDWLQEAMANLMYLPYIAG